VSWEEPVALGGTLLAMLLLWLGLRPREGRASHRKRQASASARSEAQDGRAQAQTQAEQADAGEQVLTSADTLDQILEEIQTKKEHVETTSEGLVDRIDQAEDFDALQTIQEELGRGEDNDL